LDGVQAREPKQKQYNNGNVPFELQIQSNTIISTLGKYSANSSLTTKPDKIKFSKIYNTSNRISKLHIHISYIIHRDKYFFKFNTIQNQKNLITEIV